MDLSFFLRDDSVESVDTVFTTLQFCRQWSLLDLDDASLGDFVKRMLPAGSAVHLSLTRIHAKLANWCMVVMCNKLQQDIWDVKSPGQRIDNIFRRRTDDLINLEWACMNWADRMEKSGCVLVAGDAYHRFFEKHFLHWLEVMYLIKAGEKVDESIRLYQHALQNSPHAPESLRSFVADAKSFNLQFHWILKQAPLQVYCAGLLFVSPRNELKQHFRSQLHPCIKGAQIAEARVRGAMGEFNHVNDLTFTHNGTQIASASQLLAARAWDVATRSPIYKFGYYNEHVRVTSVSISPDGTMFAVGAGTVPKDEVQIWDVMTRKILQTHKVYCGKFNSMCFSKDSKVLAFASSDDTLTHWDFTDAGTLKKSSRQFIGVNSITFSSDGSMIAAGCEGGLIRLWNVSSDAETVLEGHLSRVNSVAFSADGRLLLSGSDDMTVKLWNASSLSSELKPLVGHTNKVMAVAFSEDSSLVVSGSEDRTAKLWDATTGDLLYTLENHASGVNAVRFSPNGNILATGSFNAEIRLFDAKTWSYLGVLKDLKIGRKETRAGSSTDKDFQGHSSEVTCVQFSSDGRLVASSSDDKIVKIWTNEGTELQELKGHSDTVTSVVFSPDNRTLASTSKDKTVKLWDSTTGELLHTLKGHSRGISFAKFSKDGQLLVSCSSDETMRVWNMKTGGTELYTLEGGFGTAYDVAFAPDGNAIASCLDNSTIRLWELTNDRSSPAEAVSLGESAPQLGSPSSDATIRRPGRGFRPRNPFDLFGNLAISPDGRWLVSSTTIGEVFAWDLLEEGKSPCSFKLNADFQRMTFSDDGLYLNTNKGTIDVREIASSSWSPKLCPYPFSVGGKWLKRGRDRLVWILDDCRSASWATYGNMVVMGHTSGRVSFIPVLPF